MLSKIIHEHLDEQDKIGGDIDKYIDRVMSSIDINALMNDPHGQLSQIVDEVNSRIIDKFQPLAHREGMNFAKEIKKRDVLIDPSKDPTKNSDVLK